MNAYEALDLKGIRSALERIATALESLTAPPPAPAANPVCAHPVEARIDFGVTGGVEDFECRDCGYRSVPPKES